MINYYKLTIHDAPHFVFLYFEWMYNMMSIYIKEAGKITDHVKTLYQWDWKTAQGGGSSYSFLHTKYMYQYNYPLIMVCGFIEELYGGIF